jgi:N4-gp56 family major capsid protein
MAYTGISTAGTSVALPEGVRDVYSLDVMHESLAVMKYEQFFVQKTELGTQKGNVVKITTYDDLTRGGALTEGTAMTIQTMVAAQQDITIGEFGNAVGLTEKLRVLSWDDMWVEGKFLLARDYSVVRDLDLRDSLVASGTVIFTNGTTLGTCDDPLDMTAIRTGIENLETVDAPKFRDPSGAGDFYVCFIHPHQLSAIRVDPDWEAAQNYAGARRIFNGEVGRWSDCIFISTNHQGNGAVASTHPGYDATLDGTGLGAVNLYRATMFSDQAGGIADALFVEIRNDGITDFGRSHAIAWYALWGSKALKSAYIQHIISG